MALIGDENVPQRSRPFPQAIGACNMPRISIRLPGSFEERCATLAKTKDDQARAMKPGPERDAAMRAERQIKIASDLEKWLSSPGLRSPS